MTSSSTANDQPSFLIIGSGIYGSSTALHLARKGYKNVTILDRSNDGFASSDAASNDINKIIRADYKDEMYCSLGKEAITQWRIDDIFSPFYHETGVVFRSGDGKDAFTERFRKQSEDGIINARREMDRRLELATKGKRLPERAYLLHNKENLLRSFPTSMHDKLGKGFDGFGETQYGYVNRRGGWAEANNATRACLREAIRIGEVKVIGKAIVCEAVYDDVDKDHVIGVRTKDGRTFFADYIIVAAGSWSRLLLKTLFPKSQTNTIPPAFPSAQCVLTIQLTSQEAAPFRYSPVVVNHSNGFYIFEPNANKILKCAIHGSEGYANPAPNYDEENDKPYPSFDQGMQSNYSSYQQPANFSKPSAEQFIPQDKVDQMMNELEKLYPEVVRSVEKERISTRICWYSDTHDENWLIDFLPKTKNVLVVGGDSGHAFKFLPIIGRLILARIGLPEFEPLTEHQKRVFSFDHHMDLTNRVNQGERIQSADSGRSSGPVMSE